MRICILATDSREHFRDYGNFTPYFGAAPEALLQGFALLPELEVHVVSCTQRPMQSPEKLAGNIWFHSLQVPKTGWLRTLYQGCIRATRKKLREIRPDIVHGQGTERDCAISAVLSGFPNVVTIHGNMAELSRLFQARFGSYHWLAARLEDFTLPRTAGVFCNSSYTESLVRPRAKKVWRVPNALRREFFDTPRKTTATAKCVLLNVGAIVERKRQWELLDVVENLHRRNLKFEFHFIGRLNPAEPYAAAFSKRLKLLEAAGVARYFGEMSTTELIHHFDMANGLVHFPSEEAFGLVVAEALARGLKFFGARLGGIADIADGVVGAELFGANDWDRLSDALANWISPGHLSVAGASAAMRERYHPEVIVRRHLEIYEEVLSSKRTAQRE